MKNFNAQENRIAKTGFGRRFVQTFIASVIMLSSSAPLIMNASPMSAAAADIAVVGEMKDYDFADPIQKIAYNNARSQGIKFLDKGLEALLKNVPFGNSIKDLVKDQILAAFGLEDEKPMTTDELGKKIDQLEEKMDQAFDKQTRELIDAMSRTAVVQKYKGDMDTLAATADVAAIISDADEFDDLSEEDKLVKLAMVVGNSDDWTRTGSFMHAYTAVTNDMLGKSYSGNMDFFTALYEEQKKNYQFSGEVLDVIEPYIQKMVLDYVRYTTILLASLDAQEQIIYGDFDASKITDKQIRSQYKKLTNDRTTIKKAKIVVSKNLFGSETFTENSISIPKVSSIKYDSDNYDNVFVHLNKLLTMNRLIHVPTGKTLNPELNEETGDLLIDGDLDATKDFGTGVLQKTAAEDFKKRITGQKENGYDHNCFDEDQMTKLFAHIEKQVAAGKYTNVLDYLEKMGFVVNKVWKSSYTGLDMEFPTTVAEGWWFISGGGYKEKDYALSFCGRDMKICVDAFDLKTGKKQSIIWKSIYNCKETSYCYAENFLMFHEATDPNVRQVREENSRKRQEAENKQQQMYKLMEIMVDNFNYYYDRYEDLRKAFGHDVNKLAEHFGTYGMKEGRQVSKYFDFQFYRKMNPDIEKKFGSDNEKIFMDFFMNGVYEGRQASPYYDDAYYAANYPDTASLTPYDRFVHFLTKGQTVGRFGSEYDKQTRMEEYRKIMDEA